MSDILRKRLPPADKMGVADRYDLVFQLIEPLIDVFRSMSDRTYIENELPTLDVSILPFVHGALRASIEAVLLFIIIEHQRLCETRIRTLSKDPVLTTIGHEVTPEWYGTFAIPHVTTKMIEKHQAEKMASAAIKNAPVINKMSDTQIQQQLLTAAKLYFEKESILSQLLQSQARSKEDIEQAKKRYESYLTLQKLLDGMRAEKYELQSTELLSLIKLFNDTLEDPNPNPQIYDTLLYLIQLSGSLHTSTLSHPDQLDLTLHTIAMFRDTEEVSSLVTDLFAESRKAIQLSSLLIRSLCVQLVDRSTSAADKQLLITFIQKISSSSAPQYQLATEMLPTQILMHSYSLFDTVHISTLCDVLTQHGLGELAANIALLADDMADHEAVINALSQRPQTHTRFHPAIHMPKSQIKFSFLQPAQQEIIRELAPELPLRRLHCQKENSGEIFFKVYFEAEQPTLLELYWNPTSQQVRVGSRQLSPEESRPVIQYMQDVLYTFHQFSLQQTTQPPQRKLTKRQRAAVTPTHEEVTSPAPNGLEIVSRKLYPHRLIAPSTLDVPLSHQEEYKKFLADYNMTRPEDHIMHFNSEILREGDGGYRLKRIGGGRLRITYDRMEGNESIGIIRSVFLREGDDDYKLQ